VSKRSIPLDGLLMRPRPEPGESWIGYLARLAADNEIMGIAQLGRILGVSEASLKRGQLDDGDIFAITVFYGSSLELRPMTARQPSSARFCPICVDKPMPIFKAEWDRPLAIKCAFHDCLLVDKCSDCDSQIRHDRRLRTACNCGCAFASTNYSPIPDWVYAMEAAYAEAINFIGNPVTEPTSEIEKLAAKALRFFAHFDKTPEQRRKRRRPHASVAMLHSDEFEALNKNFKVCPLGLPVGFRTWFAEASAKEALLFIQNCQLDKFEKIYMTLNALRTS
jgi:hypothetical protein